MLKEGTKAPDFILPGSDGKMHSLLSQKGNLVVLYFYPKDNTPGCTKEACDFNDNLDRLAKKGCIVFGISKDSIQSHKKFIDKYQLNFTLLSDESLETHMDYEVLDTHKVIRTTFLIDKNGMIAKIWPGVSVKGHVDAVLKSL